MKNDKVKEQFYLFFLDAKKIPVSSSYRVSVMEKLGFAFAMLQPWAFAEDQQSPPLVLIKDATGSYWNLSRAFSIPI